MGVKYQNKNESTPGPGHFDPKTDYTKARAPGYSMKTITHGLKSEQEKNPGPGSYESPQKKPKGSVYLSTDQRYKAQKETPGPGSYNHD